jgi:predicted Zn-dependent protease
MRAGIHPKGIPEMFRTLLEERQRRPEGVEAWFATHPLEEDRISHTQALIDAVDDAILATLTVDTPNFQSFKRRVASLPAAG